MTTYTLEEFKKVFDVGNEFVLLTYGNGTNKLKDLEGITCKENGDLNTEKFKIAFCSKDDICDHICVFDTDIEGENFWKDPIMYDVEFAEDCKIEGKYSTRMLASHVILSNKRSAWTDLDFTKEVVRKHPEYFCKIPGETKGKYIGYIISEMKDEFQRKYIDNGMVCLHLLEDDLCSDGIRFEKSCIHVFLKNLSEDDVKYKEVIDFVNYICTHEQKYRDFIMGVLEKYFRDTDT